MAEQNAQSTEKNLSMLKKGTVDVVSEKIRQFQDSKEIHLPQDYSAENALKAAWLVLQDTKDKNGNLALSTCTTDSIANALLDMVVQGLNPVKKQCYFVVFGNKLTLMRSYFGTMAVAKMAVKAVDIDPQVVYKGDDFEYQIENGRKKFVHHKQKFENIDSENILAAYCIIKFGDGRPDYMDVMNIKQIKQAWAQGVAYKEGGNGTHQKFSEDMAKKTIINRTCKPYINSSSDDYLLLHHFNRTDEVMAELETEEEIATNANKDTIDIEAKVQPDTQGGEQSNLPLGGPGY